MIIWNSFLAGTFFVFLLQGIIKGFPWYHILLISFVFSINLFDAIHEYKRRK